MLAGRPVARGAGRGLDEWEVHLSNDEFSRLDTFEAHALARADKAYNKGRYKEAQPLYESFVLEFGKSRAVPYALLRKARCLHKLAKRFKAVEAYQEVLDYFPNRARYAAAALYYQGLCHWQNGEEAKALAKWRKMARDSDYSKHFLAAPAIYQLAGQLAKQGQLDKAAEYYAKVAVTFRRSNRTAARQALAKAVYHYVRGNPNEPKLRELYVKAGTFDPYYPRRVKGDVSNDRSYWSAVLQHVKRYGEFKETETQLRERYFRYWAGQMRGKFPDWDDFQIDLANFTLVYEKDLARWQQRLDRQFAARHRKGDYARVVRWIAAYAGHKAKVKQYYAKLDFPRMSNTQIATLMKIMYDRLKDPELGRNVLGKLRLKEMPDKEKTALERYFWRRDEQVVRRVCEGMTDADLGRMELLRYYRYRRNPKAGLPIAEKMTAVSRYAAEAQWLKAELLQIAGKYAKAISAYQACGNPPENIWRIAECYAALGKLAPAVRELRQVESFFRDRYGPEAALRVAHLYRHFKLKEKYVAELRAVLKKYPGSRQSSQAHVELENMGYKPGGGEDAKD